MTDYPGGIDFSLPVRFLSETGLMGTHGKYRLFMGMMKFDDSVLTCILVIPG